MLKTREPLKVLINLEYTSSLWMRDNGLSLAMIIVVAAATTSSARVAPYVNYLHKVFAFINGGYCFSN